MSEECITSVDAEPEVNSKRQLDVDIGFPVEADSELEEIVEEGESDLRTRSARNRERRKTLKQYFLDSPLETKVENAYQVPAMDLQVQLLGCDQSETIIVKILHYCQPFVQKRRLRSPCDGYKRRALFWRTTLESVASIVSSLWFGS